MGMNPFEHGSAVFTDVMKTEGLKQALEEHGFDAAFGGARRDEEKSRAKERVFSFRSAQHRWDPKRQRPELWRLYNGRTSPGTSMRVFPLSNWTEMDVWLYIYKESIPIVDLYLARERPVVERDGTLIMVDDDRMPLNDGEKPSMRKVRFRTLGDYALSGAIESDADTLEAVIAEMMLGGDVRAPGPPDRPRRARVDGAQEAGGVLLMARAPAAGESLATYLEGQERKGLLRFITCGSVDDGKSTLIGRLLLRVRAAARRPARHAARRLQARGHPGRRARLRAAARRPLGRARAGHHHRRRPPLLRDRRAQVHRRRHARPRAVHAQHGHRRLERRLRRDPRRRAQRDGDADAPPQLPGVDARHPPRRAGRQQDGSRRLLAGSLRRDRRRVPQVRRRHRDARGHVHPAVAR